jgi:hypothetical protein
MACRPQSVQSVEAQFALVLTPGDAAVSGGAGRRLAQPINCLPYTNRRISVSICIIARR